MKKISFLIMQWLLISCLVMAGISAISQGVTAGTAGQGSGFTLSNPVVSPAEVETGQTITISATVKENNNVVVFAQMSKRMFNFCKHILSLTFSYLFHYQVQLVRHKYQSF